MEQFTNEDLIRMLANATLTYHVCSGHTKAFHNERIANNYRAELERRKVEIPAKEELFRIGIFNGKGSW